MTIEFTCSCANPGNTVTVTISDSSTAVKCPACGRICKAREIVGYVYILSNSAMPGLIKIGHTTRAVDERIAELNSATGIPTPFIIEDYFESTDPQSHENILHKLLERYRVSSNREFFRVTKEEAIGAARRVTGKASKRPVVDRQLQNLLPASPSASRVSYLKAHPATNWRCSQCSLIFTSRNRQCIHCGKPADPYQSSV